MDKGQNGSPILKDADAPQLRCMYAILCTRILKREWSVSSSCLLYNIILARSVMLRAVVHVITVRSVR